MIAPATCRASSRKSARIVRNLPHYLKAPRLQGAHALELHAAPEPCQRRHDHRRGRATTSEEAGDASLFFVDEAAYLEHPALIEAALTATTDVRIDISTPCIGSLVQRVGEQEFGEQVRLRYFRLPLAHGGVGQSQARGA